MSAALTRDDLDLALRAFAEVRSELMSSKEGESR
jgi:hypothetical protein